MPVEALWSVAGGRKRRIRLGQPETGGGALDVLETLAPWAHDAAKLRLAVAEAAVECGDASGAGEQAGAARESCSPLHRDRTAWCWLIPCLLRQRPVVS